MNGQYSGTVGKFATAVFLSLPDSTVLGGGMTDVNGCLELSMAENASLVQVSMIGYETAKNRL